MASNLIVEDGSIVANADSYVTAAEADTYWLTNRNNNAIWLAASVGQKDQALREATQFLDNAYDWLGGRRNYSQSLRWPRVLWWTKDNKVLNVNTIPDAIKVAQMELAIEAVGGRLITGAPKASLERGGMISSESLSGMAIQYSSSAPGGISYPFIDLIVADYVQGAKYGALSGEAVRS
jgi:hypothetical protein